MRKTLGIILSLLFLQSLWAAEIGEYFDKYSGNPLDIPANEADAGPVHPDVLYFPEGPDGYKYWMYFEGVFITNDFEDLRLVRSNDGINFMEDGISNPVIAPSAGTWDASAIYDPTIIKVNNSWYCWYGGWSGGVRSIGLATSSDGKTWTKITDGIGSTSRVLVPSGSGDEAGNLFYSPTVWYSQQNSKFYMHYVSTVSGSDRVVRLADSNDGKVWEKLGTVYSITNIWHLTVTRDAAADLFFMYWNARPDIVDGLHLVYSTDLVNWTPSDVNHVIDVNGGAGWDEYNIYASTPLNDGFGDIVYFYGQMQFYYSCARPPTNDYYRIGFATSGEQQLPPVKKYFIGVKK